MTSLYDRFTIFATGSLLAFVLTFWFSGLAHAQQSVLPGYQVCSTASGSTQCSFQPVSVANPLPVTSGGGGLIAAVTVADGADIALGTTTDSPATVPTTGTAATTIALLKALNNTASTGIAANRSVNLTQVGGAAVALGSAVSASSIPVVIASNQGAVPTTTAPSASASIGITPVVSTAAEASHVLKASAGNVYSAYANNFSATTGWLVLINATSAPADGAITPLACALLSPNGVASINYAPGPPGVFTTGITAVVSSGATCFTKTTGVITAYISGSVQ